MAAELSPLFNLLMELWLATGRRTKRQQLIDTLMARGDRALQSDALQRLTSIQADAGDHAGAWKSFARAQSLNPNDPALSILEVTTLVSEGRLAEAQSRAHWWAVFLAKQKDPELVDLIDHLKQVVDDPHGGMFSAAIQGDEDLMRLRCLLQSAPPPQVQHHFKVEMIDDGAGNLQAMTSAFLPVSALQKLEVKWRKVFPQSKPDLTAMQNFADDVWDDAVPWLDLLEKHPLLWSSFDVLDDLVMAAETVPLPGVMERLLMPLAERAAEQLSLTLETHGGGAVQCPWVVWEHRPVLRPIAHLAYCCHEAGNWSRFTELAQWLVFDLNPNDNHGLRVDLSNAYVRLDRWSDVLKLQARYPGDHQPTVALNAVLAAFVQGDLDVAQNLLAWASEAYPVALKMLLSAAPKPVKPDGEYGVIVGGKYEAWLYVDEMRHFWARVGALDWARLQTRLPSAKTRASGGARK